MESGKYERIVIPALVFVLLIAGWGYGISQFYWKKPSDAQPLPTRTLTRTNVGSSSPIRGTIAAPYVPSDPQWREKFDKVYTLADSENVKFIKTPSIPERDTFFRVSSSNGNATVPTTMILRYENGRAMIYTSLSGGSRLPLSTMAQLIGGVPTMQLDIPPTVLLPETGGDWLFRPTATPAQRMTGLGEAIAAATGKKYHFEQQSVDKDVVLVSGTYVFKPLEGATQQGVQIYLDAPDSSPQIANLPMTSFLSRLTSMTGVQFSMDPSQPPGPSPVVMHALHTSLLQARTPTGISPEQLDKVLNLLSQQTGMTFKKDKRKMDLWKLIEG